MRDGLGNFFHAELPWQKGSGKEALAKRLWQKGPGKNMLVEKGMKIPGYSGDEI